MTFFKISAALVGMALTSAAFAAERFTYDHNGSRMAVTVEGRDVSITYDRPRASLSKLGVRPGTLLFDGRLESGYLEGSSRIFTRRCGVLDYFVYGDFRAGTDFRLNGAAPVLARDSCRIVDNRSDGANGNLVFTAARAQTSDRPVVPVRPVRPEPMGACVTGVNTTLNLRAGPGTQFGRTGEVVAGACGGNVLPACEDGWCVVRFGDMVGWAAMRYIRQ